MNDKNNNNNHNTVIIIYTIRISFFYLFNKKKSQ